MRMIVVAGPQAGIAIVGHADDRADTSVSPTRRCDFRPAMSRPANTGPGAVSASLKLRISDIPLPGPTPTRHREASNLHSWSLGADTVAAIGQHPVHRSRHQLDQAR
jgi:hypothetical protein